MLKAEVKEHLKNDIIPFWQGMKDEVYGGFYGYLGFDLKLDKEAVKGCILNSRILWFFSNAYMILGEKSLLESARHAFLFLKEHCVDRQYGGVYWSLNYKGEPDDTTKHTYNQAFAIYALSSYYDASRDEEALEIAHSLYNLVETKCKDEYGYLEAFSRNFEPVDNDKLSENGVLAEKTMNTLLHVFEAYTELYRVAGEAFVQIIFGLCWISLLIKSIIRNLVVRRFSLTEHGIHLLICTPMGMISRQHGLLTEDLEFLVMQFIRRSLHQSRKQLRKTFITEHILIIHW